MYAQEFWYDAYDTVFALSLGGYRHMILGLWILILKILFSLIDRHPSVEQGKDEFVTQPAVYLGFQMESLEDLWGVRY